MPVKIPVAPQVVKWAITRAGLTLDDVRRDFPKVDGWLDGTHQPTLRQLESFADKVLVPLGYLLLDSPPRENLPVPDYRTVDDLHVDRPSPALIETIQDAQRRQLWMRSYLESEGVAPLDFVGSAQISEDPVDLANRIRTRLGLKPNWAELLPNWEHSLRELRNAIESVGISVAISGIVGTNTHRPLDPSEFRGFVLSDEFAPLIFVNGADAKSAQMFTLAHELVHVWLGRGGLFDLALTMPTKDQGEKFCNKVAAELLVPENLVRLKWKEVAGQSTPLFRLAKLFKVSPIVAARRAMDVGLIPQSAFFAFYRKREDEWKEEKEKAKKKEQQGNFYMTQGVRLGKRFSEAVIQATHEGKLLYADAYELTLLRGKAFSNYSSRFTR